MSVPSPDITFVLYDIRTKEYSQRFTEPTQPSKQGYGEVSSSSLSNSLINNQYIPLILILNGVVVKNPFKQYIERFKNSFASKKALFALIKAPSYYLSFANGYGLSFGVLDKIANNAVRAILKCYSFTGSLTKEDLHGYAWEGILSAIMQIKFQAVKNKAAYCYVFAKGYITHALHRKSRMVKISWDDIKAQKPGTAHLSYSWDNLPEPVYVESPDKSLYDLVAEFSDVDRKRLLTNKPLSSAGNLLVEKIKNEAQ